MSCYIIQIIKKTCQINYQAKYLKNLPDKNELSAEKIINLWEKLKIKIFQKDLI